MKTTGIDKHGKESWSSIWYKNVVASSSLRRYISVQDASDHCTKIINKRSNIKNIGAIVGNKSVQTTSRWNLEVIYVLPNLCSTS